MASCYVFLLFYIGLVKRTTRSYFNIIVIVYIYIYTQRVPDRLYETCAECVFF